VIIVNPPFIIAVALSSLYLVIVFYFFIGWLRLKKPADKTAAEFDSKLSFVSIIIPVRNEEEHIKPCLEAIFKQQYPAHLFEVIVIDDYSTDNTLSLAREINQRNLLVLDLQQYLGRPGEYSPNKKKAISLGVKNARGSLILTTDGDCIMEERWLKSMTTYYLANQFKLITGPVMIKPAKNPLAWFQQLDVINMAGITGATIRNNFPTMCNGANLMYSKKVFLEVEGFKGNHEVPTGDDIFLMHKIDEHYPNSIGYLKSFEACVFTKPEKTFKNFIAQRVRWVSKSKNIGNRKSGIILVYAWLFNLLIIITAMLALQPEEQSWVPLAVAGGTKILADLLFDIPVTYFFHKMILLLLLPVIEIFHVFYVVIIGALSLSGTYRWKDRLIK
jgi:cellulose synthase/poly-beta-1,6-N-acetylglucosamine synthase-like glycosyltransferase